MKASLAQYLSHHLPALQDLANEQDRDLFLPTLSEREARAIQVLDAASCMKAPPCSIWVTREESVWVELENSETLGVGMEEEPVRKVWSPSKKIYGAERCFYLDDCPFLENVAKHPNENQSFVDLYGYSLVQKGGEECASIIMELGELTLESHLSSLCSDKGLSEVQLIEKITRVFLDFLDLCADLVNDEPFEEWGYQSCPWGHRDTNPTNIMLVRNSEELQPKFIEPGDIVTLEQSGEDFYKVFFDNVLAILADDGGKKLSPPVLEHIKTTFDCDTTSPNLSDSDECNREDALKNIGAMGQHVRMVMEGALDLAMKREQVLQSAIVEHRSIMGVKISPQDKQQLTSMRMNLVLP